MPTLTRSAGSHGLGVLVWIATVIELTTETEVTLYSRNESPWPILIMRLIDTLTSLALSGVPSWKVTPGRRWNVHVVPVRFHDVARAGRILFGALSLYRV